MSKPLFSDGIGYEGKITLTLKSDNRTLMSKTYKNHGTANLFKFLGDCLVGSFDEAKQLLPSKLLLLYNNSDKSAARNPQLVEAASIPWSTLAKAPSIISKGDAVSVVYSFEVARNEIISDFNQVALYGATTNSIMDFSAYYYLTDVYDKLKAEEVSEWSATTILLIEWELKLSNKNVEVNNT